MADPREALEDLLDHAREDDGVVAVLQHGSSLAGGPARDLDVCVVLDPACFDEPSEGSSRSLRYHAFSSWERHSGLDVSIFHELPMYIRNRVLSDHEILLVNDEPTLYEIAIETVKAWGDYEPMYRAYLEAVARGDPPLTRRRRAP